MMEPDVIRVLIVDDHPLMRSGIAGEINAQKDMRVVAEASDGAEAIEAYRKHRPDVTLMDLRMPGIGGIEAITRIRVDFPVSRFVILTSSAGDVQAVRAFQAGATDTCSRTCFEQNSSTPFDWCTQAKRRCRRRLHSRSPSTRWRIQSLQGSSKC